MPWLYQLERRSCAGHCEALHSWVDDFPGSTRGPRRSGLPGSAPAPAPCLWCPRNFNRAGRKNPLLTREPFFESPSSSHSCRGLLSVKRQFPIHHHHPRDTLRGCGSHRGLRAERRPSPARSQKLPFSQLRGREEFFILSWKLSYTFSFQLTHQVSI